MRKFLKAILVSLALSGVFALAACGSAPQHNAPSAVKVMQGSPLGAALIAHGYTLVAVNEGGTIFVFVVCPSGVSVFDCGRNVHNEGSLKHPNVYVKNNKIVTLEGPHDFKGDERTYRVAVPDAFQNFAGLTPEMQIALLGIMPAVAKQIGRPSGYGQKTLYLPIIGPVDAWVQSRD